MNHQTGGRSIYGLAAFGALIVAGGVVSLAASARQSPAQSKRAVPPAPLSPGGKQPSLPAPGGKQPSLPGLGKSSTPRSTSSGAPVPARDAQNDPIISFDEWDSNEKTGLTKGKNVVYTEGEMKFTGMTAVYNKNSRELDAQGSLELDDPKHHVTGDRSHVDRKKQIATIAGSVVITLKPTPPAPGVPADGDSAKQRQYPVIITCDRVQDAYKKEFIVLTGHLVFKQTIRKDDGKMVERTLTAEHAEYDGKANKLHLFLPVKASDSEGQKIDFEKDVYAGTKEGEETLTSPGKAIIHLNPDDVKGDDPADSKETPPPPEVKKPN